FDGGVRERPRRSALSRLDVERPGVWDTAHQRGKADADSYRVWIPTIDACLRHHLFGCQSAARKPWQHYRGDRLPNAMWVSPGERLQRERAAPLRPFLKFQIQFADFTILQMRIANLQRQERNAAFDLVWVLAVVRTEQLEQPFGVFKLSRHHNR